MHTRLKSALGIFTAASLLSGSAFAFAPEFTGDLPTVVITDALTDGATGNIYDPNNATTQFVFRYDNAIGLIPLLNLNSNPAGTVKFLFNEFPFTSPNFASPSTVQTLAINGHTSSSTIPTTSDVNTSGFSVTELTAGGQLNFRNIDFSPGTGTGPFDAVGDVTGFNLASGQYNRLVTLYIQSSNISAPLTARGVETFEVVTKLSSGAVGNRDGLSPAFTTDPFTCVYNSTSQANKFGGWVRNNPYGANFFYQPPTNGAELVDDNGSVPPTSSTRTTTGFSYTPTAVTAANGTTDLTYAISPTQVGLTGWGAQIANSAGIPALSANTLYKMRSKISSSNAATNAWFRTYFGDTKTSGLSGSGYLASTGRTGQPVGKNWPRVTTTPTNFYNYLYTEGAETAVNLVVFDIVAYAGEGNEVTISEVEICSAPRSSLTGGTVILNRGGTVPTLYAGETSTVDATGLAAFTTATGQSGKSVDNHDSNTNSSATSSATTTAGLVAINQAAPSAAGNWPNYVATAFAYGTQGAFPTAGTEAFEASEGKLYLVDYWMSSGTPAATIFGQLRLTAIINETYFNYTLFELDNAVANLTKLQGATARQYTEVFQPQLAGNGSSGVQLAWELLRFGNPERIEAGGATLNVHRVIVTEYPAVNAAP